MVCISHLRTSKEKVPQIARTKLRTVSINSNDLIAEELRFYQLSWLAREFQFHENDHFSFCRRNFLFPRIMPVLDMPFKGIDASSKSQTTHSKTENNRVRYTRWNCPKIIRVDRIEN